jgi:hypothetical protein
MLESALGKTNYIQDAPASNMEDILDIVSMIARGSCKGLYDPASEMVSCWEGMNVWRGDSSVIG